MDVCARWTFQGPLSQVVLEASVQSSIGPVQRKEVLNTHTHTHTKSEIQHMQRCDKFNSLIVQIKKLKS